jgi:WD40 repeat protein
VYCHGLKKEVKLVGSHDLNSVRMSQKVCVEHGSQTKIYGDDIKLVLNMFRIYNTRSGKQQKCYSGTPSSDGTLLRLELDPSDRYVATSSSDKTLNIYDYFSGECAATMFGHSEISTGIKFLDNQKHFVSVSVDGSVLHSLLKWR